MRGHADGRRRDWWAALALPVASVGIVVLYRGLYLATPFGTVEADPGARALLLVGTALMLGAAAPLIIRRRRLLATLVALPGVATLAMNLSLPDSAAAWFVFLPLAPLCVAGAIVAAASIGASKSIS